MGMEQPTFDPHDDEYKKVADLPEEEQKNFADVEGGFITKSAKLFENAVLADEKLREKMGDKIKGTKKVEEFPVADIIQGRATKSAKQYMEEEENQRRYKALIAGEDFVNRKP